MEIEDGELIVIAGSSGCGKSTLLRLVAGLEEITTGELFIDGKVVNDLEPKKRNVAMVFQNYALFPNLSVAANMEFALKMQRMPKNERTERVEAMAKILGIEELLNRKAKGLSGGQCQRISIGRALVCEPNVFLLDEPLSNLDASMRTTLRTEIADLQRRLKVTTLYVTHDQTEMMTLASRVVVMDKGEIQQIDTPQNIYTKPANIFVAHFIGSIPMNLFEVQCIQSGQEVSLRVGEQQILLPTLKGKTLLEGGFAGKSVTAGIRSEHIYPTCEGITFPNVTLAPLEATVDTIDILGAEMKLNLHAGNAPLSAMARTYTQVKRKDTLTLNLAVDHLHIFDMETGEAIAH